MKLKTVLLALGILANTALAGEPFQVGTKVRILSGPSQNLLGVVVSMNGVTAEVRVKRIVNVRVEPVKVDANGEKFNDNDFYEERIEPGIPYAAIRSQTLEDANLRIGELAQNIDEKSGLYGIVGRILARDGNKVIFRAQKRMNYEKVNYMLPESSMKYFRPSQYRPKVDASVRIDEEGIRKGILGTVLFQNGAEALVEYKSNSGTVLQVMIKNSLLTVLAERVQPDFAIEWLSETFETMGRITYETKQAIYNRLAKKIDEIAPISPDPIQYAASINSRIFVLGALNGVIHSLPSEAELQDVIPQYEAMMKRVLPKGVLLEVPYSESIATTAAVVLESCVSGLTAALAGKDLESVQKLKLAAGIYLASTKKKKDLDALLVEFSAQELLLERLEKNNLTQGVVISIRTVIDYMSKKL